MSPEKYQLDRIERKLDWIAWKLRKQAKDGPLDEAFYRGFVDPCAYANEKLKDVRVWPGDHESDITLRTTDSGGTGPTGKESP